MKIIITTGIFPPDIGGPASYVPKMAQELVHRGHSVIVICLSDLIDNNDNNYLFRIKRIKRKSFKLWRMLLTSFIIYRYSRKADLIYANGLGFEAMLAGLLSGVSVIHKIVGDYAWERARNRAWFSGTIEEYQSASKGLLLHLIDWIRTAPLQRAALIIVPSGYLKRLVTSWGIPGEKIHVIYNSVDFSNNDAIIGLLPNFRGKTLITVCRLVAWKGVDKLIYVLTKFPHCRLVIIGDGPLRAQLEQLASDIGVLDRTVFLGNVSKDSVFSYLKQSDLFILNSSYEGLPHVALEAMAAGVPVVATATGGTGEVVIDGETGLLVPVDDEQRLLSAIKKILDDNPYSQRLVHTALEYLQEKFSHAYMIEQTEKVLVFTGNNK